MTLRASFAKASAFARTASDTEALAVAAAAMAMRARVDFIFGLRAVMSGFGIKFVVRITENIYDYSPSILLFIHSEMEN